jgi:hypothetical protein
LLCKRPLFARRAALTRCLFCCRYNAVKGWEAATRAGSGEHFIRENFLSRATLQMLQVQTPPCNCHTFLNSSIPLLQCMRRQFVDILRSAGFLPQHSDAAGKLSSEAEMLGGSAANENSSQLDVIVAVVAAGLYPNVVSVGQRHGRPSMRPPKLTVRGIGRVELHPKSALAGTAAFPQPYLVYGTLVRSSACFVHDASCVPIMALMLFGGTLSVKEVSGAAGAVAMTADSWLTLHVAAESAACVMALTQRLHHCLQAKFTTPSLDMYAISLPSPVLFTSRVFLRSAATQIRGQQLRSHLEGDTAFAALQCHAGPHCSKRRSCNFCCRSRCSQRQRRRREISGRRAAVAFCAVCENVRDRWRGKVTIVNHKIKLRRIV